LMGMTAPLYIGTIAKHRAAAAADSAALAAADIASGLIPGYPCAAAEQLSIHNGAELIDCSVSGLIVTVTVRVDSGVGKVKLRAKAGPGGP
jgi:secretion/DNA translocation related TadE-like protein